MARKNYKTALDRVKKEEDNEVEKDYIMEYEVLTNGREFPYLKEKELESFLEKVSEKVGIYKKSTSNYYGNFGEEEEYTIESDRNFKEAIEDMKEAIERTVGNEAFKGLKGEKNIARTYLMSKNIMDNRQFINELSYYDIGTNVIYRTAGDDDKIYLLTDFQKVELMDAINKKDAEGKSYDTDRDGISDKKELNRTEEIDVTEFIRKTLYAERYGKDSVDIKEAEKKKREEEIDKILRTYKNNVKLNFENQKNSNDYEYQLWYNEKEDKLEVTAYSYYSNPVLKDTDFDGIDDGFGYMKNEKGEEILVNEAMENKDLRPLDNSFKGRLNSSRISDRESIEIDMAMDYRYFLMDNKLYYDELSTVSLLLANSIYMHGDKQKLHSGIVIEDLQNRTDEEIETMEFKGIKYKNLQIKKLMEFFGFNDVKTYYLGNPGDLGDENREYFLKNYGEIDEKTKELTDKVDTI